MDADSLIRAQVRALQEQLGWAEKSLAEADIAERVRDAAKNGFGVLFNRRRGELEKLAGAAASADKWKMLSKSGQQCAELFQECLGFLGGALMRDKGAEGGICDIAESLLYQLSDDLPRTVTWDGVTLLAEANFFTETTGLVRLPFPDYGIWNLPIAVHELGHFVGPRFSDGGDGFPFRDLLCEKKLNNCLKAEKLSDEELETQISHLRELFSDLFAVYAVGPAYACSCLLLSFNPADETACEDSETHPSHARRAHLILTALDQMSKSEPGQPYENVVNTLRGLWSANLAAAGRDDCLSDKDGAAVKYQLFPLYTMVNAHLSTVRYAGRDRARRLRETLLSDEEPSALLKPEDRLADVINAAWGWRLNQEQEDDDEVHRVQLKAAALCREIMRRYRARREGQD
jgi:hypothetical protein